MLHRWMASRMALIVSVACGALLIAIPALLALADDDDDTRVSGLRLERRGDEVVTVDLTHKELLDETGNPTDATTPTPEPTQGATPTPTPTPTASTPAAPSGPCEGVAVPAGANLQSVVDAAPDGAALCLAAGTYTTSSPIRPKSGQRFIGAGRDATFVTTDSAPAVFDAKGVSGVVWQNLDISGATGSESCKPSCGRGISGGANSVIDNVRIHDNANAGIGGTDGSVAISNSELDHNGSDAFVGCCAAGIKSANGYTITNSFIHDNLGVGVWCDVGCEGIPFQVLGNTITNNLMGGVRFEISSGPSIVRGNTVQNNNLAGQGGHGGIEINSSQNATVEGNTLGGNNGAGIIANGNRSPGLQNVVIANNSLSGDEVNGCGGGVTCTSNS
jgi:parallel beta-helix repeat protein